ncbi:hypothetical protein GH714_020020 [Hevea brasiliensis]|uniref:Sucrose phosphatase-like domain-containing protein n=1 Tax=Hevea brasiliensis TaxID=3981 RepID=A0A6A6LCA3_HEVBR|nr:hypothetical protein GH714_020020 [Hevea brasiliensis]
MLFVIAADCYDCNGKSTVNFQEIIKNVMKAAGLCLGLGRIGFVLLTGSSLRETMEALKSCPVNIEDFDAIICNSGSEMYYPWRDMVADLDYEAHVGQTSGSRSYSYIIKPGAKTRKVDEIRQRLRMRGFRCNLVYTRAASRLNVIPLFASRKQALRYLSVKWGIDLSKIFVFVGEKGDTDYEELLAGLHKTIIMRGSVGYGSEKLLRSQDSFKREDIVPQESPSLGFVEENYEVHDLSAALEALGIK